jgi:hypothetical protein
VSRVSHLPAPTAVLFALLLLPLMIVLSRDYGATWDEPLQQERGEHIVAWYTGRVAQLQVPEDGAHLYGAPFDVLAVAVQGMVPWETYRVRHALNAFVGWLGIVFCGLLAWRLFDPGTALLAMVLLASMPRYFGHSMNNPKDIPFATLATVVLYLLCRLPARYPFFTWRSAVSLTLALGLALNVRPGALLFLGYTVVLLLFRLDKPLAWRQVLRTAAWLAAISVGTLALGSMFWPWALQRPLIGPVLGVAEVSRFGWPGVMLFAGRDIPASETPAAYVPVWMALTIPIVVFAGLGLSLLHMRPRAALFPKIVGLWAAVVFPVVYVIGVGAVLYDGLRHLLFTFPPMAIVAAAGWIIALRGGHRVTSGIGAAALVAALLPPVLFSVREHPNQVVYFNELSGGPASVYGRYEMDYWGNCILQALAKVDGLAASHAPPVKVSGWPLNLVRADAVRYPRLRVTERNDPTHQMDVVLARGSGAEVTGLAARRDLLARVMTRDGALLCAVLPGPAFDTVTRSVSGTGHLHDRNLRLTAAVRPLP